MKFNSIKQRMLFGFSTIILLVILLGVFIVIDTNSNNKVAEDIVNRELPLTMLETNYATNIANRVAAARAYVLFGGDYKNDFYELTNEGRKFEEMIRNIYATEEFDKLVERTVVWREYVVNNVFTEFDKGNQEVAIKRMADIDKVASDIISEFQIMADERKDSILSKTEQIIVNGENSLTISIIITALVILISLIIAFITSNKISKPINIVMERMKTIANGDLSASELKTKSSDEIGQLVTATNAMNDNMRKLMYEVFEVSQTVNTKSDELSNAANEVKEGSRQVTSTMQELAIALEKEANFVNDVSAAMNNFTMKIQEANESGENIRTATNGILTLTSKGNELMESSLQQMILIDRIVQNAVQKVDGLDAHTQEITSLVSVIQNIADQTNLLALNAAIEAARAGEHGKGFAVVADEVRKLAEESSASVSKITDIVTKIQNESSAVSSSLQNGYKDVEEGTKQITATNEMFNEISGAVENMINNIRVVTDNLTGIFDMSQQINSSIQEIAAITQETSAGIEQTTASTEQTNATMEEVALSSNNLAKLAENLTQHVQQFKL